MAARGTWKNVRQVSACVCELSILYIWYLWHSYGMTRGKAHLVTSWRWLHCSPGLATLLHLLTSSPLQVGVGIRVPTRAIMCIQFRSGLMAALCQQTQSIGGLLSPRLAERKQTNRIPNKSLASLRGGPGDQTSNGGRPRLS